jgi:hypothetical protein
MKTVIDENLKYIGTIPNVPQYGSAADFYIQDDHPSGVRHLVVCYEKGGYDGRPKFMSGIPSDWTEAEVLDFIFWPAKPEAAYPTWEAPARIYGSDTLFRWWKGEKPR